MLTFLETTDSVTAGNHIHRKQVGPLNTDTNLSNDGVEVLTEMSVVTGVRPAACPDPELSYVMLRESAGRRRCGLPSVATFTRQRGKIRKIVVAGGEILNCESNVKGTLHSAPSYTRK